MDRHISRMDYEDVNGVLRVHRNQRSDIQTEEMTGFAHVLAPRQDLLHSQYANAHRTFSLQRNFSVLLLWLHSHDDVAGRCVWELRSADQLDQKDVCEQLSIRALPGPSECLPCIRTTSKGSI